MDRGRESSQLGQTEADSAPTMSKCRVPGCSRSALFITECSFVHNKPVDIHVNLPEVMFLVRKAEPRRVMLTHLYSEWDEIDATKEIAAFQPPCEVLLAFDGMVVDL
ncbi:hypothetical protein [Leptolyngbya sp. 7M]|uniref:hypothetical protein n=1 Tax=Leptolyngbya sp. 7M TaxID=2812896 RepID=UPI001B8B74F4|nr:hypothetical protein [Leptolyngbya sp. 7M]QYO68888.1 hypothetical protein JVX88_17685 [Leptolyngbya sp. 7M]